jgi:hypothetical protein
MPPKFESPYAIIVSHPRSGTHLLESCMASHPKIHKRSECVLRYKQLLDKKTRKTALRDQRIFKNQAGRVNIAIVMYAELPLFEQLCGPVTRVKVIHLLRNPVAVARSFAQWEANKARYGKKARAHYKAGEKPAPNAPFSEESIRSITREVKKQQKKHVALFARHLSALTVAYEEFTDNQQVGHLPEEFCQKILGFIGLPLRPLTCDLRKTGS